MSNIDYKKKYFEQLLSKKNILPSIKYIEKYIFNLFHKKYCFSKNYYDKMITNNIIFNQKIHIVAKFKEFLVLDDLSEFLKRYYTKKESNIRLPLYFAYYHAYSKIFPNYTALNESKYIYKNIHRKQKMIDMQQEEKLEEMNKEKRKKEIKHQRKNNKQEINTIFDNDVYNSIIKQSQDLYMILFGINKENKGVENSFSFCDIKDIVNSIDKYVYESKIGFNYKNNLIMPMYKNIDTKKFFLKDNNSSFITKQSTFNTSSLYQKIKNFKHRDDIVVGLKKIKNEKKYINSNSLLISQKIKKKTARGHLKSLTSGQFFSNTKENSKSKSKKKDNKKQNTIRVNKKLLIDENNNSLTDRNLIQNNCKNLKKYIFYNSSTANNSKKKSNILNKKLNDFNFKKINNIKISNYNTRRQIRINKNDNKNSKNMNINRANRTFGKNVIEYNKLKINITKIRGLIKNNKIVDKFCYTERNSISPAYRYKKIQKVQKNRNFENLIFKKINNHRKSIPSIDIKAKVNKNIILSKKIISFKKNNIIRYRTNFLPLPFKEYFKINKNQIKLICNKKINSNFDKTEDKKYYTERGSIQYESSKSSQEKKKSNRYNDISFLKKIAFKYYNTATNSKKKDKTKNNKENMNNCKNSYRFQKFNKLYKKKKIEISPINNYNDLINTERNKRFFDFKKLLNKKKK
jgi:hypothetical protein